MKEETNKPGIIPLRKEEDRRATRYTVIIPKALTRLPRVGLMAVVDGVSLLMLHVHLQSQLQRKKEHEGSVSSEHRRIGAWILATEDCGQ